MILIDQQGKEWELKEKPLEMTPLWYWSDLVGVALAILAAHLIFI